MAKELVKHADPMREVAVSSQNALMAAVTQFGHYVDRAGVAATSPKGMVISINRDIKRAYGVARDDMPRDMLLHVSSALVRVVAVIEQGIQDRETRDEIKRAVHAAIKASGESYLALTGTNHARH
jgi:hypothetical protein